MINSPHIRVLRPYLRDSLQVRYKFAFEVIGNKRLQGCLKNAGVFERMLIFVSFFLGHIQLYNSL